LGKRKEKKKKEEKNIVRQCYNGRFARPLKRRISAKS